MERTVNLYLRGMEIENPQVHEDMGLFPIKSKLPPGPDYLTLSEALESGCFEVTEVDPGGSVSELKAANNGEKPVLLLDGEELKGAKQNRVLNTTILIGPKTTVVIPVSCVEAHRWHGESLHMSRSDNVMASNIRRHKMEHVHNNLEREKTFRAGQQEIWEDINFIARELKVDSATGAMSDIFSKKEKDLEEYLKAFPLIPEQKGLLVFLNGKPVGLDFVSRDSAFSRLYSKLLKSYILEALTLKYEMWPKENREREKKQNQKSKDQVTPGLEQARAFIEEASRCQEKRFQSIGMGTSCRYLSDRLLGAALEVDGSIPHLAFFIIDDGHRGNRSAGEGENFPRLRIRKSYLFNRAKE